MSSAFLQLNYNSFCTCGVLSVSTPLQSHLPPQHQTCCMRSKATSKEVFCTSNSFCSWCAFCLHCRDSLLRANAKVRHAAMPRTCVRLAVSPAAATTHFAQEPTGCCLFLDHCGANTKKTSFWCSNAAVYLAVRFFTGNSFCT